MDDVVDTRKPTPPSPSAPTPLGVVLAGGRSRRFGSDKARVEVDHEPLVVRTARLVGHELEVVVVGDPALAELFAAPPPFLADPLLGPLGAVVAAWRASRRPLVVFACDLPALNAETVARLARPTATARVPLVHGARQWLSAHYGMYALATMDAAWEDGERSMWRVGERLELEADPDPERSDAAWDEHALADADTPEELGAILRRASPRTR
jgi:molybdopterin-guanine dinucleotide biosynthesis protein A